MNPLPRWHHFVSDNMNISVNFIGANRYFPKFPNLVKLLLSSIDLLMGQLPLGHHLILEGPGFLKLHCIEFLRIALFPK